MIGATGMGEREAQFYSDVAPSVNVLVPGCSFAGERRRHLRAPARGPLGARVPVRVERRVGRRRPTPRPDALEDLAVFHARFEDAAERDRVAPWLVDPPTRSMSEATSGLMRWVLDENAGNAHRRLLHHR